MDYNEENELHRRHLERHHAVLSDWLKQIASISAALIGFVAAFLRPDAYPGISWVAAYKTILLVMALLTILAAITAHRGLWKTYLRLANQVWSSRIHPSHKARDRSVKTGPSAFEQFCISASFWLFVASVCALTCGFIALTLESS